MKRKHNTQSMNKTLIKYFLVAKKAFTLVEILTVTSIIGILITATTIPLNRMWLNNQVDICESEIREMTAGFKSYITDYGGIVIANDMNYETVVGEIINTLNKQYLSYELQLDSVATDKKSVLLSTKIKTDPWGGNYKLSVYTYAGTEHDSIPGLVIISSSGVDRKSNISTYKDGKYGDDVLGVIEPKK